MMMTMTMMTMVTMIMENVTHVICYQECIFFSSGEKCNPEELGRLLQLILGCAINCHHKQGNSNSKHHKNFFFFWY